jgi:cytoskeletal protein CcmA (bactofilin family)
METEGFMSTAGQTVSLSSVAALETSSASAPKCKAPAQICDDLRSYSSGEVKIGRGQFVKGKISGSGPLFIDGRVEGDIDIPNERVTIGEHGVFVAHVRKDGQFGITAREIVIMGQVIGSVSASHRVEIFQSGSITGDLETPRLRIADGGFCKGGVNLREEKRDLREDAA